MEDGAVAAIEVLENADTPKYFDRALAVIDSVINSQSLDVDTVSGATYSSDGIINAVKNALENAVINGELECKEIELPARGGKGGKSGRH